MAKTTRDKIVQQARDMFRDLGYAGFSMGDLAISLGIRKASLYSRFAGKDELAQAAIALTLTELGAIAAAGTTWQDRYRALLTGIGDYLTASRRCIGLHMLYGAGSENLAGANRDFFAGLLAACTDILSAALPPDQARMLAEDSISAIEGATIWLILNDDAGPMQRAIDAVLITAENLANSAPDSQRMADEIQRLEGDVLTLRAALAGQIEAESCFR